MKNSLLKLITTLVTIAGLSALILGFVFDATKEDIKLAQDNAELNAVKEVLPVEFDNNPFTEKTKIANDTMELYPARKDGIIVATAIKTFSDNGYGGRIELIVGFMLDGTISGYKIISHKETPGLGTKVMEEKFSSQFKGLNPSKADLRVKKDGGEIDAVTAATISSRAVTEAVKQAYDAYAKFLKGARGDANEQD